MSVNNVTISGNLAKPVELRFAGSGTAVAGFIVAHTPRKKQGNDWVDGETVWMDVTAFGSLAESLADLGRGTAVVVQGKLEQQSWEDKNGGGKRSKIVAIASDVSLGVKRVKADTQQPSSNPATDW